MLPCLWHSSTYMSKGIMRYMSLSDLAFWLKSWCFHKLIKVIIALLRTFKCNTHIRTLWTCQDSPVMKKCNIKKGVLHIVCLPIHPLKRSVLVAMATSSWPLSRGQCQQHPFFASYSLYEFHTFLSAYSTLALILLIFDTLHQWRVFFSSNSLSMYILKWLIDIRTRITNFAFFFKK